ncbi:penicillin-binding protein 2 [Microseira wollei]|uniref:Peptidoglycan glycosyltransferase n=1 Tax=Microseira wollei NIES-4236 TaxID=2530354 RepID=A0AAV3X570_9CYAN|nr:penicillin-binding protein 2 [Microseira wollei]GET35332.1 peptidoglycan glycosyltransferase [Microseira wollei NIES-4236]
MAGRIPIPFRSKRRVANLSREANPVRPQTAARPTSAKYRAVVLMLMVTSFMSVCTARLVQLQLLQGQYYRKQAEQNRVRLIPMASARGNIVDRKGKVMAASRVARSVFVWPLQQTPAQWQVTANKLSAILDIPSEEILEKLDQAGYVSALPVRVAQNLSPEAFVALEELATQFQGLEIRAESSRYYPNGEIASHVLGYIGEATSADMKANPDFPVGMIVGKMGVERLADKQIRGIWGSRLIEVDARGKELREMGIRQPQAGAQVTLTLDLDLQKTAEQALGRRRGAVAVIDPRTGAVLALASTPTFDPNFFTRKVSRAEWQSLQARNKPFLNRALQGYPPGSTFKIVTSAAGMGSGKYSPGSRIATSAGISLGGFFFGEHSGSGYGVIGFRQALAVSSNTFFYRMGLKVGPEEISKWGHKLGIGNVTDLKLPGGTHGSLPTPEEKQKLYKEPWYPGDTISMSIGQGLVLVTPLEMAVVVSAIANGGMRVKPHLLADQTKTAEYKPEPTGLSPDAVDAIRSGLRAAVTQGTAKKLNDGSLPPTAGKTGTAEVPHGRRSNAVFVGYAPVNKPTIAIAVVVENGGYGGVTAVPIAREVFRTYFNQRK